MAAQAATKMLSSYDQRARLRSDHMQARREQRPTTSKNFLDLTAIKTAAGLTQHPTTTTAGEQYQRAFRQRQIAHQIGESVGLNLGSRQSDDQLSSDFSDLSDNYAAQAALALLQNQLGLDERMTQAKNRALKNLKERGLKEGFDMLLKAGAKEIGAVTVSVTAAAGEVIDSAFEDMGIVEGATFVQNQVQAVRTIFSPPPPPPEAATDLKSLDENVQRLAKDMVLDTLFPRFNLHTVSGLTSLGKAIYQWFLLSLMLIAICAYISICFAVLYFMYYVFSWLPGL